MRLKGGDPYVLGRGSEEVLACHRAGVPVEVIPGVTSAISVPGAAGIPLTHRGMSHLFTVVSGHAPLTPSELEHLAGLGGTIVVLMGVNTLPSLTAGLARFGMSAEMPVAIVERGFRADQRTTIGDLADIVFAAGRAGVTLARRRRDRRGRAARARRRRERGRAHGTRGGVRGGRLMTDVAECPPGFRPDQLEGFRIGVTSDRRSADLIDALARRGAQVLHAPTLRMANAVSDEPVIDDTRAIIAARPDVLLATTAYGVRRWFEVADAAGLGEDLVDALSDTAILVRGPKARGGIRAAGLNDVGMSAEETTESLIDEVLDEVPVRAHRRRAAARVPEPLAARPAARRARPRASRSSRTAGSSPTRATSASTGSSTRPAPAASTASPSRARPPCTRCSAPPRRGAATTTSSTRCAARSSPPRSGRSRPRPLIDAGITPIQPERYRMGALIRLVCEHLESSRVLRLETRHGPIALRGSVVDVDDRRVALAPVALTILRTLVQARGSVVARERLASGLPGTSDLHALEVALSRLRQTLGVPGLIATVVKRGYRIDV